MAPTLGILGGSAIVSARSNSKGAQVPFQVADLVKRSDKLGLSTETAEKTSGKQN